MTTRAEIVAQARKYLNVRWHHQARSTAGMDCIGLVICVAHDLGLSDFDITDYGRTPDPRMMLALLRENMDAVTTPQEGDILLMRFEAEPQHVAIVTDIGIIHAYAQMRRVVEHRLDSLWQSRVIAAYAYKGIA